MKGRFSGEYDAIAVVHKFFPGTGTTYDLIAKLCTFGFDGRWKEKMIRMIPTGSAWVMDQACGTGILTCEIARRFPDCRVIGVDVMAEYLDIAKEKATSYGLGNVEFIVGRAEEVFLEQGFDCITSSYLAKYAELGRLIPNIRNMLRDGGILIMHDFTYPRNPPFALLWQFYFKLLQTIGTRMYPQWKAAFDGLPGLLSESRWVDETVRRLRDNGFSDITVESLTIGTAAIVTARKGGTKL